MFKSIPALIKAAGEADGLPAGQFSAYASVFDTVDSMGDVVQQGAFTDTLADWQKSGSPIPIYFAHRMDDPMMNLGEVTSAEQDDHGLLIHGQLDITDNEKANYVYRLLKGRRVGQMSFAYDVLDSDERDGGGLDLKTLRLHEVSVVPVGANQDTAILDVKQAKAGRMISAANEAGLRAALEALSSASKAINAVLAGLDSPKPDAPKPPPPAPPSGPGKASGTGDVKDEGHTVKSEGRADNPSVDSWAAILAFHDTERSTT